MPLPVAARAALGRSERSCRPGVWGWVGCLASAGNAGAPRPQPCRGFSHARRVVGKGRYYDSAPASSGSPRLLRVPERGGETSAGLRLGAAMDIWHTDTNFDDYRASLEKPPTSGDQTCSTLEWPCPPARCRCPARSGRALGILAGGQGHW